eukprot:431137-Rhodomonas_salina.3
MVQPVSPPRIASHMRQARLHLDLLDHLAVVLELAEPLVENDSLVHLMPEAEHDDAVDKQFHDQRLDYQPHLGPHHPRTRPFACLRPASQQCPQLFFLHSKRRDRHVLEHLPDAIEVDAAAAGVLGARVDELEQGFRGRVDGAALVEGRDRHRHLHRGLQHDRQWPRVERAEQHRALIARQRTARRCVLERRVELLAALVGLERRHVDELRRRRPVFEARVGVHVPGRVRRRLKQLAPRLRVVVDAEDNVCVSWQGAWEPPERRHWVRGG